jgi:hypothetical protein
MPIKRVFLGYYSRSNEAKRKRDLKIWLKDSGRDELQKNDKKTRVSVTNPKCRGAKVNPPGRCKERKRLLKKRLIKVY